MKTLLIILSNFYVRQAHFLRHGGSLYLEHVHAALGGWRGGLRLRA